MADLIQVGRSEVLNRTTIKLPGYTELTDNRVVKEMQTVFKGFEFDPTMAVEHTFKTTEQIETYVANIIKEINVADNDFKLQAISNAGAIAARRWHFGHMVNKFLKSSAYGERLAEKIADAAGMSLSYLYQFRAVGDNLSIKDAYILGMYGAGWELIRGLAAIGDADDIRNLIQFYVASIKDYNDPLEIERSKAALSNALKMLKEGTMEAIDVASSPEQIAKALTVETDAPEYVAAKKQLEKLKTACRNIVKDNKIEPMLKAFADCFIPSSVFEADTQLELLHTSADDALALIQQVENTLPLLKQELESLKGIALTSTE